MENGLEAFYLYKGALNSWMYCEMFEELDKKGKDYVIIVDQAGIHKLTLLLMLYHWEKMNIYSTLLDPHGWTLRSMPLIHSNRNTGLWESKTLKTNDKPNPEFS